MPARARSLLLYRLLTIRWSRSSFGWRWELDEEAVREFIRADYARLVAALTAVTGSRADAEDAVQEALARAWDRSGIETPLAWITTVAVNWLRSVLRRRAVDRRARDALADSAPRADGGSDARLDVRRALLSLPRRQREVLVLRYFLEMDLRTIAEVLGTTEGTVKVTLHRARAALGSVIGANDEEEVSRDAGR
jgi:RNA polymerase sigma-70 factor, ECF subfamily